ncbi:unnamed protein product [marine sediment metagenome]|uniref:Glyoxalase/fosfomycin resistance/dioxygenase domain-containing protein n=1 Tax=marine sediment metagenome TaxID=412755 RepID=X1CAY9_9ZZZZ
MFKKLIPNLMVEDVNYTVDYYENILGCFELIATDPREGKFDWAMMRSEEADIMFQSRESLCGVIPDFKNKKIGATLVIYIEVDNVEELYNLIKNKVDIIKELNTTSYGMKEFLVRDCNGYILVFAQ